MKRLSLLIAVVAIVSGVFMVSRSAQAADSNIMTEAHIATIRSNCVAAQSTLTRLHASDALVRVDRGQLYDIILSKLMSPMNSRIALNSLDSLTLPAITSRYEQQIQAFRDRYKTYEESLSATLRIDCVKQPVAFYDAVSDARAKRKLVHDTTLLLTKTIGDYKLEFERFVKQHKEIQ